MSRRGSAARTARRRVFEIVEEAAPGDTASRAFDWFLIVLITLNITAVVLHTVPSLEARYGHLFHYFEIFSVFAFTVEYILRLWASPEHASFRHFGPVGGRVRYAFSFFALVDLAAIVPFYLQTILGFDLRILRILRLLRFLKLMRYSAAMMTMQRVVYEERRSLLAALLLMLGLLIIASTGMYYVEHEVQPEHFGSIPAAMWWGLATLTTVGYGDIVPVTLPGKLIGGVVMLLGIGMFALPVGILATGFTQEVKRREFVVTRSMVERLALFDGLPHHEIARLTRQMRAIRYDVGSVILRRGEPVDSIYFIAVGDVDMEIGDRSFHLEDGDVFGETATVRRVEDDVLAIASSQSLIMALDMRDLNPLMDKYPRIAGMLRESAEERLTPPERAPRDGDGDGQADAAR